MNKATKLAAAALLLLTVSILAYAGWQYARDARDNEVSDAQTLIKPEPEPEPGGEPPPMDFTGLQKENPEIVGWISIPRLGIDYPVVQGTDNSYYLTRTAQRKTSKLGALFLDFRANKDFSDFNSVIYGHNMQSGRMFGTLRQMREQAAFDRVKEGTLSTPGGTYRLEIFAVVAADSRSRFYDYIFASPDSKTAHLDMVRAQAIFYRGIGVTADDRILALSTCSYEYIDARTLVIARIV